MFSKSQRANTRSKIEVRRLMEDSKIENYPQPILFVHPFRLVKITLLEPVLLQNLIPDQILDALSPQRL